MRKIGSLRKEAEARRLRNMLYVRGVASQVEQGGDGWEVWVEQEDEVDAARELLRQFEAGEIDDEQEQAAIEAEKQRLREKIRDAAARANYVDVGDQWRSEGFLSRGLTPLTAALIVLSIAAAGITRLGDDRQACQPFHITKFTINERRDTIEWNKGLPEIRRGQLWRLVTPVFVHVGILHIVFNMLWLKDLGAMVERRQGWLVLLAIVCAIGVVSNLAQYKSTGPNFGGMSGVVYGLLGYIWLRGRLDPTSGYFLDPRTATWMGIWLVLCMTGMMGPIGNAAHLVGLLAGMAWGFLASGRLRRMLRG